MSNDHCDHYVSSTARLLAADITGIHKFIPRHDPAAFDEARGPNGARRTPLSLWDNEQEQRMLAPWERNNDN